MGRQFRCTVEYVEGRLPDNPLNRTKYTIAEDTGELNIAMVRDHLIKPWAIDCCCTFQWRSKRKSLSVRNNQYLERQPVKTISIVFDLSQAFLLTKDEDGTDE